VRVFPRREEKKSIAPVERSAVHARMSRACTKQQNSDRESLDRSLGESSGIDEKKIDYQISEG